MNRFIFIMIIFSVFTVNSQFYESKDVEFLQSSSWLNIQYIECLKNKLPCECEKQVNTYFSLSINSDYKWISLCEFAYWEPGIFKIKEIDQNKYGILHWQKKDSIWATIEITSDTLYLTKIDIISKFVKSKTVKGYDDRHHKKDNIELLNRSLITRGYPKLEEIVTHDTLRCDCNKTLDKVNLISVQGRPLHWVLTIEDDSLNFYKVTNPDGDPSDPMITEKIKSFKWDKL